MTKDTSKPRLPAKSWIVAGVALLMLGTSCATMQSGGDPAAETPEPRETQGALATATQVVRPAPTQDEGEIAQPDRSPDADGIWEGVTGDFDLYVLALSWQPAFCETRPDKEECFTQTEGQFDATNFALHGLWPDDGDRDFDDTVYCDVSQGMVQQDKAGGWCDLQDLGLSGGVEADLFVLMPGATSCLQNHEWVKHGTCSELSPEAYYALSNHLTALFSQTAFNAYVAERVGTEVSRNELLDRFEEEFGSGSDQYLSLQCDDVAGTSMLTELYITLGQDIDAEAAFGELFPDRSVRPQGSCPRMFWIDEVGIGN